MVRGRKRCRHLHERQPVEWEAAISASLFLPLKYRAARFLLFRFGVGDQVQGSDRGRMEPDAGAGPRKGSRIPRFLRWKPLVQRSDADQLQSGPPEYAWYRRPDNRGASSIPAVVVLSNSQQRRFRKLSGWYVFCPQAQQQLSI